MSRVRSVASALALISFLNFSVSANADVLYKYSDGALFDGLYGPIALAQKAAKEALAACHSTVAVTVDGRFARGTRKALQKLAECPAIAPKLQDDQDGREGALTTTFWSALVGAAPPDVNARARTLMLTYEATDYTRMEWNFCQSSPRYDPEHGKLKCFSNDPHSYLTWGPNGATAGGGREIQIILSAIDAANSSLIDDAFGGESSAVRRMFSIADRDSGRSLETYLCGVWADRGRREAWRAGFDQIGRVAIVRKVFDDIYRSASLDGGKIRTFQRAYEANGLVATEIDYAFFKDRAAHTSPSLQPIEEAVRKALRSDSAAAHWKIRRSIAREVRPSSQRKDRLGRDVAFYVDGNGLTALTSEELDAWRDRGSLRASDAGLSDTRNYGPFTPGPAIASGISNPSALTPAERAACPAAVLATHRP